jgi:VanZ family protein
MKRYLKSQPLSILVIAAVWVACMVPIPETPLDNISMIDKWTHFVMYCTIVVVIMAEYGHRSKAVNWRHLTVGGIVLPVVMGGLVELAQAYLTNGVRSGDWLDFLANTIGVFIGCAIGIPLALFLSRRNRGDGTYKHCGNACQK